MRYVRTCLLATVLVAAPAHLGFAQGAPPKQPAATAKPAAPPAATATAAPQPTATSAQTAAPAGRDIATEVDAAMDQKAQALFKEGNAAFRDAKYAQAQASYKAAWALELRSPKIVRNLGLTELELKMYRDAAEHLTIALRLSDPADPKRPKIQSEVAEARAKVAAVTLKLNVDGVELVQMDNGRSYTTPLADPIFVDPGKVGFRVRREGYMSQEKVLEVKPGEEVSADVTLERAPGYGGALGTATATTTSTAPGAPRSKVPGFVLGGVGVAALAIGGALVGVAAGTPAQMDAKLPRDANGNSRCTRAPRTGEDPACAEVRSIAESGSTTGNAGVGLLVGGGVLVAAGVIYLLIPSKKAGADATSSRVLPAVGSDGGGLVWTGSF